MISYRQPLLPARTLIAGPLATNRPTHMELFQWLDKCAEVGEKCPSLTAICNRFEIVTEPNATRLFNQLERQGFIACFSMRNSRTVLVLATGKHTKPPKNCPEWDAWIEKRRSHLP